LEELIGGCANCTVQIEAIDDEYSLKDFHVINAYNNQQILVSPGLTCLQGCSRARMPTSVAVGQKMAGFSR